MLGEDDHSVSLFMCKREGQGSRESNDFLLGDGVRILVWRMNDEDHDSMIGAFCVLVFFLLGRKRLQAYGQQAALHLENG